MRHEWLLTYYAAGAWDVSSPRPFGSFILHSAGTGGPPGRAARCSACRSFLTKVLISNFRKHLNCKWLQNYIYLKTKKKKRCIWDTMVKIKSCFVIIHETISTHQLATQSNQFLRLPKTPSLPAHLAGFKHAVSVYCGDWPRRQQPYNAPGRWCDEAKHGVWWSWLAESAGCFLIRSIELKLFCHWVSLSKNMIRVLMRGRQIILLIDIVFWFHLLVFD